MINKTISHYKILEKLGEGGMGVVYLAEDTKLKRQVAIKFLPRHITSNSDERKRFEIEAQAAAALNHPNIATIYAIEHTDDDVFIVMEYIEGHELKEEVKSKKLEAGKVVELALQIAEGLQAAHKKNITHRDIKSANIMVTEEGQVKIMDFGLAKVGKGIQLTKENSTLGTAPYMSPEQLRGENVDHRSDIWSFGVVLYEMLTGELPFKGEYEQAVVYAIMNEEPVFNGEIWKACPAQLIALIEKSFQKEPSLRTASISEFRSDLEQIKAQLTNVEKKKTGPANKYFKPAFLIPLGFLIIISSFFIGRGFYRMNKIRWARDVALPKIEELRSKGGGLSANNIEAFDFAVKAERFIPDDHTLKNHMKWVSGIISIHTEPQGAKIYRKPFNKPEAEWEFIGISPIENKRMPNFLYNWKFEKEGYETIQRLFWSHGKRKKTDAIYLPGYQNIVLDKKGTLPDGMVHIPGTEEIPDFFIDKYEVSNEQYKKFVDAGGYQNKAFWKHPFIKRGKEISWEKAMEEFRDITGRLGPSTWEVGNYPEGKKNHPVSGISWYEAAAYAEFVGKELPTVYHWNESRKKNLGHLSFLFYAMCNFNEEGPVPIGTTKAITQFGVFDMAGNVREWCWNVAKKGRCIRGGAWNDSHYMYDTVSQADPFNRSPQNGLRCVTYVDKEKISQNIFAPIISRQIRNFYNETPVSDNIFTIYKDMLSYDKIDLEPTVVDSNNQSPYWRYKKITFSTAYNNERMAIHLFLSKNSKPPYQTVIYFPGSGSTRVPSSDHIEDYSEFSIKLSHFVKDGRAVVYPIYKGTFERGDGIRSIHWRWDESYEFKDYVIKIIKDFKRVIDYLETRSDIDLDKLAYFGFSWGGVLGSIIPAVEERIKISIIDAGGLEPRWRKTKPEVDGINYISRITIPTLMLHGLYDANVPYDYCGKPMFDLLGTKDKDKKLFIYETDHIIPRKELIKESLNWLDKYFGPVTK